MAGLDPVGNGAWDCLFEYWLHVVHIVHADFTASFTAYTVLAGCHRTTGLDLALHKPPTTQRKAVHGRALLDYHPQGRSNLHKELDPVP